MSPPVPIVYVVDDDLYVLQALASVIRASGWRVRVFASAPEFLDAFRQEPRSDVPACLVLDVMLREGNALDLRDELEAAGVRMPIVFMTAHATIPMSVRAMKSGAVEFLVKPFQPGELVAALRRAIEQHTAERAIAVIDDDAGVRVALRELLRAARFATATFGSAEEYLAERSADRSADRFECLIVDINLPGISGVALLHALASRGYPVPAVLVTGRDDPETREQIELAGRVPLLRKPFGRAALFDAIAVATRP